MSDGDENYGEKKEPKNAILFGNKVFVDVIS